MQTTQNITLSIDSQKKYYVYTLAYPDGTVFYVGKGTGKRILAHEHYAAHSDADIKFYYRNAEKCRAIREIWAQGEQVQKNIVFETDVELDAHIYEWVLINMMYQGKSLTNVNNSGRTRFVTRPPHVPIEPVNVRPTKEPIEPAFATQSFNTNRVSRLPTITVDGERYYTAKEAAEYLGISRDTFYRNVKGRLPTYHYGALRREYFRQSDLDGYRGIRPAEEDKQDQD